MAKSINNSSAGAAGFDNGITKDADGIQKAPNQWSQARNAVNNTIKGDISELSNEASNYLCAEAPYTIIGSIHIEGPSWAIFSTDNENSEVGLFNEDLCSYETVVNAACLAFNTENLIKGVGRTAYDCGNRVYWDDGVNPTRILDLDDVPWVQDCEVVDSCTICTDTAELDCDKLRLAPLVKDLAFRVERGNSAGELLNGSYYVVGAYLVEGQRVTDYSLPSNVQGLFEHQNLAASLDIFIEEADQEFDEFELIVVQFANFNTIAKRLGVYSTRQKKVTLDQLSETLASVDPSDILIQNSVIDKSDAVYRNGQYLIRTGPSDKFDFNYQPLANQITSKWVSVEYPADYYRKGGSNTNYMRDEVYSFFIRWVFNTGDKSSSYHIPGRSSVKSDLTGITNDDVLDSDLDANGNPPKYWQVYNTATVDPKPPTPYPTLSDGGVVLGKGLMGYWESSEIYDDDKPQIWNAGTGNSKYDLCGKPIRHHKFPDNATDTGTSMITNHYNPEDGTKIRIMGVEFSNIKAPLDNEGNVLSNIVGYEILRGSREGNKSVLAKGMVNNLRTYETLDENQTKTFLYPNYPYNPTAPLQDTKPEGWDAFDPNQKPRGVVDRFLSKLPTSYSKGGIKAELNSNNGYLTSDTPLQNNIRKDLLTFHSPETNFRNPFLSAKEVKVYGEMNGTMVGSFQFPDNHPKHKIISDGSFLVSAIVGIGYAIIKGEGKKKTITQMPFLDHGGSYAQFGTSTGSTGFGGPSALYAGILAVINAANQGTDSVVDQSTSMGAGSLLAMLGGIDINSINDAAIKGLGSIAASAGLAGNKKTYEKETSEFSATPAPLRVLQGVPAFLTYYAEGVNKMLNLIYSFTSHKQYALQQVSHCFYDKFAAPTLGDSRREVLYQSYLNPEFQDFAQEFTINNLFRSRTVALKLNSNLKFPDLADDTQALFSDVWGRSSDLYWKNEEYINSSFERPASSHYVGLKQEITNQYGQISGINQVPVSTDYTPTSESTSEILFNGDVYIGRYTEKNTMFFFYDWLGKQPDGAVFNYKLRKMITHPRFWMDTDPFDAGEFVAGLSDIFESNKGVSQGFDPFMLTDPLNDDQTNVCDCDNINSNTCLLDTSLLSDYCDAQEDLIQAKLYYDFLNDCVCYKDTEDDGCNGDVDEPLPNPEDSADYSNCKKCNNKGCPDINSEKSNKYLTEGGTRWENKIDRAFKAIEKAEKDLSKVSEKLYKDYLKTLDTSDSDKSFFEKVGERLTTPSDKYAFDMQTPPLFRFTIKEAWMYLFTSGVRDFYVESEINVDFRDWGEKADQRHYDHESYTNLREMFSTDRIKLGNYMKYDYSLSISKLFNNFVSWGSVQDRDYDPLVAETCFIYRPKRVVYSLQQFSEDKKDNWRIFLPLNYKDFNSPVTAIKPLGKNGALFLFANESPIQVVGVDQLQTDGGTKITIGDGGLFSQPLQNLVNADYPHEYGSCQNRLSVINTPAGMFFMSQNQGKIFQVGGNGLEEISNRGMKWWFANYLPYQLTKDFSDFELTDNPLAGIGCQAIFDNENQVVFFCKKDYSLRKDIDPARVTYLGGNQFKIDSAQIELGDPSAFVSASWTASYDPKRQIWIGHHDWHPDLVIPSKRTYMTTKDNGLWVHADTCSSYCNFYGEDYPFEIEYSLHTQTQVNTLRNVMYMMEVYTYNDNCDDRFHVLDFNFDEAIVYNSEQCSGLLRLNLTPKNNAPALIGFPKVNFNSIDILFAKEEQKYRFNQFWDATDDRGEFNPNAERTIFNTAPNGYVKVLNNDNLNYDKFQLERKKFRHYKNTVFLRRKVSGKNNMIVSLAVQMNLNSPR